MKHIKYALLVVALIAAGLVYYLTQSRNTIENEFDIALSSAKEVDEIELNSGNHFVNLKKVGKRWELNGKSIAYQKRVDAFLDLLSALSVSSPVTGPKGQAIRAGFLEHGVEVVCNAGGKEVYRLDFISDPLDLNGNYAFKSNHKYVVQLGGNPQMAYAFTANPSYWQSKTIFSLSSEGIKEIVVDWRMEMENFTVRTNTKKGYDFFRDKSDQTIMADVNKIKYYTYEFANVTMDSKNIKFKDLAGDLICKVTVTDNNFQQTQAVFYALGNGNGDVDKNNLVVNIDGANVWGKISYLKMSPILKKADFFMAQ